MDPVARAVLDTLVKAGQITADQLRCYAAELEFDERGADSVEMKVTPSSCRRVKEIPASDDDMDVDSESTGTIPVYEEADFRMASPRLPCGCGGGT
jgi:polyhydroxyalkanoate synthesis regulator phasin